MKPAIVSTLCALTLAQGCARVTPRPLSLPPREAPLAQRAATYRARAAMPNMGFAGWGLRVGDGAVRAVDDARPILANAAEAEEILHTRDNQLALGWTLFGVGTAVILSSIATLPYTLDARDTRGAVVLPLTLVGLGAAIALPSAVLLGSAQRSVPTAAEAYNRWLWDELDLPRLAPDGSVSPSRSSAPTPHPATPWQTP